MSTPSSSRSFPRRSIRLIDDASAARRIGAGGLARLSDRLALAKRIARTVEGVCERRRLRASFSSPGQAVLTEDGALRLVVRTQAQAYQLRNMLPTIEAELSRSFAIPGGIRIAVNPALGDPLGPEPEPPGKPRSPNPEAAAAMLEKAKRLPEGSRVREALESLAASLKG